MYAQPQYKPYPEIAKKFPAPEAVLNNSAQGKDFWLSIPMNDSPVQPLNALEIYVTSSSNTFVYLEVPGLGFARRKPLKALDVVTFSTRDGSVSTAWEVNSSEIPDNIAIHVFADVPISVYVLNAKPVTSEGYLALPVSVWGTEYIHCSYYDFNEGRPWASGFTVIASEDNTEITINLRGRGANIARTAGGARLGSTLKATLMRGQVYNVKGDATSRGSFDMSGTKITSNKPVGLISYHQRTMLPANNTNGRDHIVEMFPPVQAWGKKYNTVEYSRDNKGDFFRIIASQNNTRWKMKYYDKQTKVLIGQREGILQAGQFYEEINNWGGSGAVESIRGTSVWEADKPVLLLQYSYSANWDNGSEFDPFYIVVTPQEQYISATVFQTPANSAFVTNWFNIIAVGDSNDLEGTKLKSIELDGKPVWITRPQLLSNRMPNTNLYWINVKVAPGPHRVKSQTVFGGYIYGFSDFDSYGWPAAMAVRKLDQIDTLPPVLTFTEDCGDFSYTATEVRNFGPPPDTAQVDQGISFIEMIDSVSTNYELEFVTADRIVVDPKVTEFKFKLNVKDKTKDAFAIFVVMDRAGNYTIDSVRYTVNRLTLDPDPVNFGKVRVNRTKQVKVKLTNTSKVVLELKELKVAVGKHFAIVGGDTSNMQPGEVRELVLSYTPDKESPDDRTFDTDSLIARTQCARFSWLLKGLGVRPCVDVEPLWDAGRVTVNNTLCKNQSSAGLRIANKGTDTLLVTGITGVKPPFSVANPTPAFPFAIPPKGSVFFNAVCFTPTQVGADSITVVFETDSEGADCSPNSLWKGVGITPGLNITDQDWGRRRVRTLQRKEVYVTNTGSAPANVTKIDLAQPQDANFRIIDIQPPVSAAAPFALRNDGSRITITVEYEPTTEASHQTTITAEANNTPSVTGNLKGIGILPKIQATGYEFTTPVLVGSYAAADGEVVIANTSTSADLFIESVDFSAAGPNRTDFEWTNPATLPKNITIPIGGNIKIPVRFRPTAVGRRITAVDIVSDAAPGPNENPRVTTNVDVIGTGIETRFPDLRVTSIDYGAVLLCNQPTSTFTVSNPGTDTLFIGSMKLEGNDPQNFTFTEPAYPVAIPPGGSLTYTVGYQPNDTRTFTARIVVTPTNLRDAGGNIVTGTVQLTGSGFNIPVEFVLDPAEILTRPGVNKTFSIRGNSQNWGGADLRNINFTMKYRTDRMKYVPGSAKAEAGLPGWAIAANESLQGLELSATGNTPATGNVLLTAEFQILLSDTASYPVDLSASVLARTVCVPVTTKSGKVTLEGCFINGRLISFTGKGFALKQITPNPVSQGEIAIDYSIGFNVKTTIEIYNALGERIALALDQHLESGEYRLSVPLDILPNGTYYCRINAGPYTDIKSFNVSK
jgi:hypothetical protein